MKIKDIRIQNYKSWSDSKLLKIYDGLNVIVGQNNVGKTALLEALSLMRGSAPHRTLITKPEHDSHIDTNATFTATFQFEENELFKIALTLTRDFFVPLQFDNQPVANAIQSVLETLKYRQQITAALQNNIIVRADFEPEWYSESRKYFRARSNRNKNVLELMDNDILMEHQIGNYTLSSLLIEEFRKRIYLLRAERYNTSQTAVQNSTEILDQNCNNLAQVLHSLQSGNPERFNRVIDLLKKVFPRIKGVTVPVNNSQAQIVIWTIDPKLERKDLAIPLSESGTGIGQVLAMLYLIIHSDTPQVILIDEPQSFLHPGAIRSLIEIFYAHNRHQYVITTHSPHILSVPTSAVIHVTHDGNESKAEVIDGLEAHEARLILQDIGFKLSDVFGANEILWVEGSTEEECFKLIARTLHQEIFWGVEILGVRSTGDLQGRHAETAYDIYTKLSKGIQIIPPAIGFIFDRELRSEKDIEDLKRKSKNKVFFLSRRMFENYLLHPDAIANLLNKIAKADEYTGSTVKSWINENGKENKYLKEKGINPFEPNWYINVDGAVLLSDLFSKLSKGTIPYDKVKHGYQLTKTILETNPEEFNEVIEILKCIKA
ncbi:MAG TPA: AAA family ATPase [Cyclobacteriaceae bacterium]